MAALVDDDKSLMIVARLKSDFLLFCKYFFPLLTGRELIIPVPPGRRSHFVVISRDLEQIFYDPAQRVMYNIPPGYGKSTIVSFWVAWCLAKNPRCNFMYVSYSADIASEHTGTIKTILQLREYEELFGVTVHKRSKANKKFATNYGGRILAAGLNGSITGFNAGTMGMKSFSGALIIDDAHKAGEVESDAIRESVIKNYMGTLMSRVRGVNVPCLFIGQILHEADLAAHLLSGKDGYDWRLIRMAALDEHNNPLYPEKDSKESLIKMREVNPYVFYTQYQQQAIAAGNSLYERDWFVLLPHEPTYLCTFITCDTAETDKSYNDASVFSYFGLYEIPGHQNEYGLHWIDCWEMRVEPAELESRFYSFWHTCSMHHPPPKFVAIEKKSTGVTLLSVLKKERGLEVRDILRPGQLNGVANSKTNRFIAMQYYIASRLISLPMHGAHTQRVLDHMCKINANNTHAKDDIGDTLSDGITIGLMNHSLAKSCKQSDTAMLNLYQNHTTQLNNARQTLWR